MLRVRGLTGVLRRLKAEVTRAAIDKTRAATQHTRSGTGSGISVRILVPPTVALN